MIKHMSLFSGIGAFEEGLKNSNVDYEVIGYSEILKPSIEIYKTIHGVTDDLNFGDITEIEPSKINDFNLMTYGFPCQDISNLGSMKGLMQDGKFTRSGLFFYAMRIAKAKQPEFMIAENVAALAKQSRFGDWFKLILHTLDMIGYNTYYKILNAKDYNLPQSRNRVFMVSIRKDIDKGFEFPKSLKLEVTAKDYYDTEVSDEYYLDNYQIETYLTEERLRKQYSSLNKPIINCMTTKQGLNSSAQNFVADEKGIRAFTSQELFAFQGFKKENATECLNKGITRRQIGIAIGNSIAVNVVTELFNEFKKQYGAYFTEKETNQAHVS